MSRPRSAWRDPLIPLTREERARELTTLSDFVIGRLWDMKHPGQVRGDRPRTELEADILRVEFPQDDQSELV
ncbi:hypothetical protein AB0M50_40245 [Nonomuraea fuscirosea]|jgi:hypothetical protein|uniref:hypothetical protein n=1 Tax=Nonomuraea fuscirosea TaxID=1291556 RepID=UPI002DDC4073|nr:hypothetical protein [Nonomuraea fuscirosea]WSA52900.1 hypothetical protein OIE67_54455 [Nonomuraea fuscirosea]